MGPLPSVDNAIDAIQEVNSPTGEDSLISLFEQAFATAEELIRIERKRHRDIDIGSVGVGLRGNEVVSLSTSKRNELNPLLAEF